MLWQSALLAAQEELAALGLEVQRLSDENKALRGEARAHQEVTARLEAQRGDAGAQAARLEAQREEASREKGRLADELVALKGQLAKREAEAQHLRHELAAKASPPHPAEPAPGTSRDPAPAPFDQVRAA